MNHLLINMLKSFWISSCLPKKTRFSSMFNHFPKERAKDRTKERTWQRKFTRVALKSNCKQLRNSGVRNFFDPVRPWPWRSREPNNSPSHKLVTSFRGMARITWQVGPVVNDRGWLDWNRGPVRECWWQRIPRRCARALPSLLMQS